MVLILDLNLNLIVSIFGFTNFKTVLTSSVGQTCWSCSKSCFDCSVICRRQSMWTLRLCCLVCIRGGTDLTSVDRLLCFVRRHHTEQEPVQSVGLKLSFKLRSLTLAL